MKNISKAKLIQVLECCTGTKGCYKCPLYGKKVEPSCQSFMCKMAAEYLKQSSDVEEAH